MSDAIEALTDEYNQQMAKEAELDAEGRECLERAIDHAREVFDKIIEGKETQRFSHINTQIDFAEVNLGKRNVYLITAEGEGIREVEVLAHPYKIALGNKTLAIGFGVDVSEGDASLPRMALPVADLDYTRKSLDAAEEFIKFADEVAAIELEEHQPFIHSNIGLGQE
jgi:hypothetical protein